MLTSFALCRQVQLLRAPEHSSPVTSRRRSHFTPVLFSIWLFQSPCSLFCHGPWVGKCDAKVPFVLSTGTILCPWISCEFLHYPQIISGSRCGYPYTIYATILPTGISSHTSRAQGSQLGKTADESSPLASYAAPPATVKVSQQGGRFLVRTNAISMSCDKYVVSSATGLTKVWTLLIENVVCLVEVFLLLLFCF
jgi:hypothetical protein